MRRRDFIALFSGAAALLLEPRLARCQQAAGLRRVGVFMPTAADDPDTTATSKAFRQELERLGWTEGRNIHIDYRYAASRSDEYPALAQELIALQPEVVFAQGTQIVATLQRQTHAIPIVFNNVSDPIGSGFVANLAHPGGNLTGILLYETGIMGKWLALLKEIAPRLTRVALVGNPKTVPFDYFQRAAAAAAPSLGIELVPTPVENADADIERAIESFAGAPNGGLLVMPDPTLRIRRDLVIALANRHRLPAVYPFRLFVAAGGLMSYGTDQDDVFRQAAGYVDHILRGAKAADLPVQAPTKYETVVNNKTAKAIGFDIPPSLLVRADEVIE
jgi:putative tryptophan/tyrosine transport system substrate-binding protein